MIHEIMHVLIKANPKALAYYGSQLGPAACIIFDPKHKSVSESMATWLAIYEALLYNPEVIRTLPEFFSFAAQKLSKLLTE